MLLAISLSQKYTATDEHGASVAKEKNTVFKFWGANMTLSVSTVSHPHSVSVRKEGKWRKKPRNIFFAWKDQGMYCFLNHKQALLSPFLPYIKSDSEFSIFYWYNLEEVTFLKVLPQKWVFCLDVCKFYSAYATCNLQIGISICKMEIKCVYASLQN